MENEMLHNFRLYFPSIANKVLEYKQLDDFELMITLDDAVIIYDDFDHSIRVLPADDELMTEEVWKREFARRLRKRMTHKGMSQAELSEVTGITQPMLSHYITGKSVPGFFTAVKIAKALGCSVDDLQYS